MKLLNKNHVSIGFFPLVFLLISNACQKSVETLNKECEAGKKDSCNKLVEIIKKKDNKSVIEQISAQVVLAEIVKTDKDWFAQSLAIDKLNDQNLLAEVVDYGGDSFLIGKAVNKIANQKLLAEIARNHKDKDIRWTALSQIWDQKLLIEITKTGMTLSARKEAVDRITDHAALIEIAKTDANWIVRRAAAEKLTKKELMELIENVLSPFWKLKKTIELKVSDPFLFEMAGDLDFPTVDSSECIIRIKLATQESIIKSRLPGLQCFGFASKIDQFYTKTGYGDANEGYKLGERIVIKLVRDGKTVAQKTWSTIFPPYANSLSFVAAEVSGVDLLKMLLNLRDFSQKDLANLSNSRIPEVRIGSVLNLTDQPLLAKIVTNCSYPEISQKAVERLTDQNLLTEIVKMDVDGCKNWRLALNKITDQALLTKIAKTHKTLEVRKASQKKLREIKTKPSKFIGSV